MFNQSKELSPKEKAWLKILDICCEGGVDEDIDEDEVFEDMAFLFDSMKIIY